MANPARKYGPHDFEKTQIFDADKKTAEKEKKYRLVEQKWGINKELLDMLENAYRGITEVALNPTVTTADVVEKTKSYQGALAQLLVLVKTELQEKEKMLPYEKPNISKSKLPLKVLRMIYPDLKIVPDASIMEHVKKIAEEAEPDAVEKRRQAKEEFGAYVDEEERRINDPTYGAQKQTEEKDTLEKALEKYKKEKDPDDVVTSVQKDLSELLTSKEEDEEEEPPTLRRPPQK